MRVPVPLRGVVSAPFRAFGIRPSRMNPNICTICELLFTTVFGARKVTIDAQSAAAAGEIRVTQAVYERVQSELAGSRAQKFQLKGFEAPTTLYAA
jgi:hypothetical protein